MDRPGQTHTSVHEGHVTGGVQHEGEEGRETTHKPDQGIWNSARAVQQPPTVTARGAVEVGGDIQETGPAQNPKNS